METSTQESWKNSTFEIREGISVTSRSNVYKVLRILRFTSFAQIAECRNEKTGEILVIKFVKDKFYSQNDRETKILTQLKNLSLHEKNIVNFSECFSYKDRICFVYEKLDKTVMELVLQANGSSVHLTEIRAIAYQMLVSLTALNKCGFTHANIKPENIACLDENSHGFKLIGFSNSAKTTDLNHVRIPLACGYSAPEIYLDCPLDASVDIWSLGLTLAFLFLGRHFSPVDCDYQYIKFITDVLGQPEKRVLDRGCQSRRFFKQVKQGSDYIWRLKTPKEFEETTGSEINRTARKNLTNINDLFLQKQRNPRDYEDTKAFLDFLKKMLKVNPADRIKPADALKHPFITMESLQISSDKCYVIESQRIMKKCHYTKPVDVYTSLSNPNDERKKTPCPDKEEKKNPSHLVQTKNKNTDTSGIKTQLETPGKKKTTPLQPRKIQRSHEDVTEVFSGKKREEPTSGKSFSVEARKAKTNTVDLDNLPLEKDSETETDDSDVEETDSTDSDSSTSSKLKPGMTIESKTKVYIVEKELGAGTYGHVFRCRIEGTNEVVALKVMDETRSHNYYNEVEILERLNNLTRFKGRFIRLNDSFTYEDLFCQELELLDEDLFDFFANRRGSLTLTEIRAITKQMLEALSALKHLGITHADIKLDNIMFVNHKEEPYRVKLIDFGLALETEHLPKEQMLQITGFRAPEVSLGLPRDEAIDTWSLGCLLSILFLDHMLFPHKNKYDNLRILVKLLGQPDEKLLENGTRVSQYFIKDKKGSWRFRTLEEYEKKNGKVSKRAEPGYDDLTSLDELFFSKNTNNSTEKEDLSAFIDLVKKMLTWDPANRILPDDALKHPFITMEHLKGASDKSYAREARRIMKNVRHRKPRNVAPDGESEITESSAGTSKEPHSHTDSEGILEKAECDESASSRETSGKSLPVEARTAKTSKADLDNLPLEKDSEWETVTDDSDKEQTDSSTSSKLKPGMMIESKTKVYIVEEELGAGAYGQVFRCRIEGTNEVVALKVMSDAEDSDFVNEVKILERLNNLTHYNNRFIRLNDSFTYEHLFCQELELLDEDLFQFFVNISVPLTLAEIRAITKQMLEALSALKHLGITHADIKPDNIMFVNHEEEPYRVKLIDFGFAVETEHLTQEEMLQNLAFRAPEVSLGLLRDEAIDTWSLGCLLSILFLDHMLIPHENEYDNLRILVKLLGQPDEKLLENGTRVSQYFIKNKKGSWRFRTLKEYEKKNGKVSKRAEPGYDDLTSLDELFFSKNTSNSTENEDISAFVDLVKKMLTWDPANRILPDDALKHPFITMEHLKGASDKSYAREARRIMKKVRHRKPRNVAPDDESEITESSAGTSKEPHSHTDSEGILEKLRFHESTTKFNSEEFVNNCIKKQNAIRDADVKRICITKVKNFFTKKYKCIKRNVSGILQVITLCFRPR